MIRLFIVDQSGLDVGGHYYSYTGCVADGARQLGLQPIVLANRKFRVTADDKGSVVPCFTHTWSEAERHGTLEWRDGNIAFELHRALKRLQAAPSDRVFLHTIGYQELLALGQWFAGRLLPGEPIPVFHLLLRRDPDTLVETFDRFARCFATIACSPYLRDRLRFHADTEQLSRVFAELTGLPFATAPIPFPQEPLRAALVARAPRQEGQKLTAVYLGDARQEKGYQHLPAALSSLWRGYVEPGKVRFVLQSNFNTPGGEPGILTAAQLLAGYPATTVLTEPLQPADYYRVLAESDLVLIPYDPVAYRNRSSGVLIEAMAAGKVVVTSDNSWMASQVTPQHAVLFDRPEQIGPAIAQALDRFATLSQGAAGRCDDVLKQSTGEHLVRHLLDAAAADPVPAISGAWRRVLLVMNGDGMVLRNGASRIAEAQLRYLNAAGVAVAALFLTARRDTEPEAKRRWRAALAEAIAPYAFERVFIAGPGGHALAADEIDALDAQRQPPDWPLRADLDFLDTFEFGAGLLRFLREHRIDAVLLNYITNYPIIDALGLAEVPVICEMHDIQSLQRAIYAQRPVDPGDLDLEMLLLGRCAALISLNPRETAIVTEHLPDIAIETTGVSLPDPRPAVGFLAGVTELREILAMAGPRAAPDTPPDVARLADAGFIDLLFVSSNHLANASGLRWFLNEVYEPFLAAHQVSVAVVGSVCELAGWPHWPRVFYIGQVVDVAPLYAAARIVILPIREGAGSPVKTIEAFAYGRPVIGTTQAFRGLEAESGEFLIRDEPAAFGETVLEALRSEALRVHAAAISHAAAQRHNNASTYHAAMDRVFGRVLGVAPTAIPPNLPTAVLPPAATTVEWSPLLQAINQIVRSFLHGYAIERWALQLVSRASRERSEPLVEAVVTTLLREGDAAILRLMPQLRARIAEQGGAKTERDLRLIWRLTAPAEARPLAAGELRFIAAAGLIPIEIVSSRQLALDADGATLAWHPLDADTSRLYRAGLMPPRASAGGLRIVQLGNLPSDAAIVLRQSLLPRHDLRHLGHPVFDEAFRLGDDGMVELAAQAAGTLVLPALASSNALGFIDLVLVNHGAPPADAALSLIVDGAPLAAGLTDLGDVTLARIRLDPARQSGDLGSIRLTLTNNQSRDALEIAGMHSGLLLGPEPEAARLATAIAAQEQRHRAAASPRLTELAQGTIVSILQGQPLAAPALVCLAGLAKHDQRDRLLRPLAEQAIRRGAGKPAREDLTESVDTLLDDIMGIVEAGNGRGAANTVLASPLLPLEVTDDDGDLLASSTAALTQRRGHSWRIRLDDLKRGERLRLTLGATLAIPGHPDIIETSGFYPPEAAQFRWTGPDPIAKIVMPVALTMPTRLILELGRTGDNVIDDDFSLFCNKVPLKHKFRPGPHHGTLTATLPAAINRGCRTEIAFRIRHQFTPPPPDLRVLGVVFCSLRLIFPCYEAVAVARSAPASSGLSGTPEGAAARTLFTE